MRPDRIVPLIIAVALFMENMDSTVIATSLPAIAADIGTNPLALKLAVTSYLLSLAVFIPASGWTADRFGARTVFRAAIAVFVLGSIGCALSGSLTDFVIARIVQGMGGAMMTPVGRMVLVRTITKRDLVGAMAWVTTPALIGPVLGPPVGGFITTFASWHWIFIINVPIGLIGIVLATRFIPDVRAEHHERFDVLGMVLAGLGIGGLAFGLSILGLNFLPWWIVVALVAVGAVFTTAYVVHARRIKNPALDLTLFRLPTFRASVLGGFIFRLGIGALPFLLPLMLQVGFGMTPFQSGLITFASALGAMSMKVVAQTALRRFGFRSILVFNGLLSAVFLAACAAFTQATPAMLMLAVLLIGGFFRSLQFTSINTIAYAEVETCPDQQGDRAGQRRPAIVDVVRRRGRRAGGRTVAALARRDCPHRRRFRPRLSRRRCHLRRLGLRLRPASARRRRRNVRPQAGDGDGNLRSAHRLTKARRQHVELGGIRTARRRLDMLDGGKIALERGEQRAFGAALQHLGEEGAALRQHVAGKFRRGFGERHDPDVIGLAVPAGIRRHVGQNHIGGTGEQRLERVGRLRIEKIKLEKFDAGNALHGENVDGDDAPPPPLRANALGRDLTPAAGRGAEIDHARALFKETKSIVDLRELEGRARAIALTLGSGDVGVIELPFEPKLRRERTALAGLDARFQFAAADFRFAHQQPLIPPPARGRVAERSEAGGSRVPNW